MAGGIQAARTYQRVLQGTWEPALYPMSAGADGLEVVLKLL